MKESQIQQMHQVIVFVLDSEFREWELGGRCAAFYAQCYWIMRPLSHPCNTISSAKVRKVILRMKHRTQCWAKCCMQQFKSGLNKMPFRHCRVEQSTAGIALSPENQENAEKKKGQTEKGKKKRQKMGKKKMWIDQTAVTNMTIKDMLVKKKFSLGVFSYKASVAKEKDYLRTDQEVLYHYVTCWNN